MTPEEIGIALQKAFDQCSQVNQALSDQQKQILLRALNGSTGAANPLAELTPEQRQVLLRFVREQEQQSRSWKMTLLNDWLQGQNSGAVQFVRDQYGIEWLEQISPAHLADYDDLEAGTGFKLKVGDRIEVTNGLWEWVQETGPCSREWFPCTVVGITVSIPDSSNAQDSLSRHDSCVVRFDSGAEYEIQGIYEWNHPNWRWLKE